MPMQSIIQVREIIGFTTGLRQPVLVRVDRPRTTCP
jgi:hypothetical protein